jgi:CheY-like chemotaxis protein
LALVVLEKLGNQVTVAVNGRQVLELLEQRAFDLVLMDLQLPEMDGYNTSSAIREKEKGTGSHLPIVAMIAYGLTTDRERWREVGMDSYVTKPLQIQELVRAMQSVVGPGASDYQL